MKDAKFGNTLVSRLVNTVMQSGKKSIAQRIVYGAFEQLAEKNPASNPLEILQRAVDNAKPRLEVKPRRVGGATYQVPVEVATDRLPGNGAASGSAPSSSGGVATLAAPVWSPPAPTLEMDAVFAAEFTVLVINVEAGPTLVGAIELVSPSNKARPAARRAFAMKCLNYLNSGIGLIIVDVVTKRRANLHDQMARLVVGNAPRFPGTP